MKVYLHLVKVAGHYCKSVNLTGMASMKRESNIWDAGKN